MSRAAQKFCVKSFTEILRENQLNIFENDFFLLANKYWINSCSRADLEGRGSGGAEGEFGRSFFQRCDPFTNQRSHLVLFYDFHFRPTNPKFF